MIRILLAALALSFTAASATAGAAAVADNPNTRVELFAESATPAPGRPLTLAVRLTPKPGWHTYWSNPGEAGFAPRAKWNAPVAPFRYPVPGQLLVAGLMNYVYEAPATLLADLTVPDGTPGAALPVTLTLDYLVCTHEQCVPEHAELSLPLTLGDGAADAGRAADFAAARAALPKPLAAAATFARANGRFVLAVPLANADKVTAAYFYAAADGIVDYAAPQAVSVDGDTLRIETKASAATGGPVAGVVTLTRAGSSAPLGLSLTAAAGPVPPAGKPLGAAASAAHDWAAFLPALLLAVVGGIVLNVMPCVFPILSLKALSLARGGATPAAARRDALAYTGGILMVCVALGGLILALRAAGTEVGWAFQLQDPRVILALLLLMTAIALNLAGLFEITIGSGSAGQGLASKPGAAGSFWTGALAAFVATPCTGPFMAGALGAALVLPPLAGLLIFAGLGLGLALPFLAVGFIPVLRTRLPRPGLWMATFRRLLSLPMFATALGLTWVLGRQAGVNAMTLGLASALLVGVLLWWFGRRQGWAATNVWPPLVLALAVAVAAVAVVPTTPAPTAGVDAPAGLGAQPFSAAAVAAVQAAHTPTLVYFTADWCLTCKVNERGALSSPAVAAAFAKAGVKTLVGDWTNGDAAIGRFLEAHGRAGVPLYLFYHADGRVEELPQILTADRLIAAAR